MTAPQRLELRPFTVGEILDRALRLHRREFKRLFFLTLVFHLPLLAASKGFQYFGYSQFPHILRPGLFASESLGGDVVLREAAWLGVSLVCLVAVLLAIHELRLATVIAAGRRAFVGEAISIGSAFRSLASRTLVLLGTWVVQMLWYLFLFALAAAPSAALATWAVLRSSTPGPLIAGAILLFVFLEVPTILWALLRFCLTTQVVMVEGRFGVRALLRSAALMKGRVPKPTGAPPTFADNCMLRASVILAVSLAVNISVASIMAVPHVAVNLAFGNNPLEPNAVDPLAVPAFAVIPIELASAALEAAVAPFWLLSMLVFYFDLRIRKEGYDLELLASDLGRKEAT